MKNEADQKLQTSASPEPELLRTGQRESEPVHATRKGEEHGAVVERVVATVDERASSRTTIFAPQKSGSAKCGVQPFEHGAAALRSAETCD